MDFNNFLSAVSGERFGRYLSACSGNRRKAIILYRLNQRLSREIFSIVSCLEVGLRNKVDAIMAASFGRDWLRDSILSGGMFDKPGTQNTKKIIGKVYQDIVGKGPYTPSKLLSKMEFGIWKYMFAGPQYTASGRLLLKAFPKKPRSTRVCRYDNTYIFGELNDINELRNRIAHNEPICFQPKTALKSSSYALSQYARLYRLLLWMDLDSRPILRHLDHVRFICRMIEIL